MQIQEVIQIIENRLSTLHNNRAYSVSIGDLATVIATDTQIDETVKTLDALRLANG